jgi:hypothetical protein
MMPSSSGKTAISAPIHHDDVKAGLHPLKRSLVSDTSHANDKTIPAGLREPFLSLYFRQFHLGKESLGMWRVLVKIIRLDFPKRARSEHQRIEVLAINEYIPAGEVVTRNSVGALVMRLAPSTGRPWNRPALRAVLSLQWLGWCASGSGPLTLWGSAPA